MRFDDHRIDDAITDIYAALHERSGQVTRGDLSAILTGAGIAATDKRIRETASALSRFGETEALTSDAFAAAIHPGEASLVERALRHELIIPDFAAFRAALEDMYAAVTEETGGDVANYIPQLARVDPDKLALAVCTIDGQTFQVGDVEDTYCVQSTCKPINYAAALTLNGEAKVHKHVGREPSGRSFNELTLNGQGLPHNPMINSGAIMCASLLHPELSLADRFDYIENVWRQLAGGRSIGFDNSVYLSEKDTAHRNFALAHFMKENNAFPEDADIYKALDLYFQCCSITVDVAAQANVAATFANGGVCPMTNQRVFPADMVKNCLSLMLSCGMYDFSGEFAFTVGLPAKSGVSGALMIVVPGLCGITLWSPRLDALGNTVRGVAFSKKLIERFPFHIYANLIAQDTTEDPRRNAMEAEADLSFGLLWAATKGDLWEIRRLRAAGVDLNITDYDGRTALHLAASEGQKRVASYLLERGADWRLKDRWGATALDDARRDGHDAVVELLEAAAAKAGKASKRKTKTTATTSKAAE